MLDRRRRKRIDVALPVILENATAVTRDASASGVFFWKRGTFMYEDSIRFAIERNTESGRILQKCRGVVVRTEPDDKGVGVAARIVESTTERAPGELALAALLEPAREELRDIARPADNAPASANGTVSPAPARKEPPAIAPPDPAREELPTIAWPTDEAFFSPRGQPRPDTQPFDGAPTSTNDAESLDFVHEQPGTIAQRRVDALASAIPTISRWTSLLRGMALDAREELQGQEVLEWNIPPAADTTMPSRRVTVCSIKVAGLRPDDSRVPGSSRFLGVSYRDLARLRAGGGFESRRTFGGAGAGGERRLLNQQNPDDARGLRIELAVGASSGSPGDGAAGGTPQPGVAVRITSVPDEREQAADTYCYEETWYSDPREAFEAFLRLAGESAILVNLALLNT